MEQSSPHDVRELYGKYNTDIYILGSGATVQYLSEGLDKGDPIFYAYGDSEYKDPFMFSMSAVKSAVDKLVVYLTTGSVDVDKPKDDFTSYKRKSDFTIKIAKELL
jgi:hypothetical protein